MEEQNYFFDSLRQTSEAPKKAKKVKEGNSSIVTPSYVYSRWFSLFITEVKHPRQPSHGAVPGDLQEEALVQREPGERPGRRSNFPLPTGMQPKRTLHLDGFHSIFFFDTRSMVLFLPPHRSCPGTCVDTTIARKRT